MNTQQLILGRIVAMIQSDHDIVVADDRLFSGDTGVLRALNADSLSQISSIEYKFDEFGAKFGPAGAHLAVHHYGKAPILSGRDYMKGSIPELIESVVAHLCTAKEES